jgi:hypothetical protein
VPDPLVLAILLPVALAASIVGGVVGFGAAIILLPVTVWTMGARASIPVLTVTMLFGSAARVWWSRHEVDWRVVLRYLVGATPATALGTLLYAETSSETLARLIGLFLLGAVPLRRLLASAWFRVRLQHFYLVGGGIGFLSGLVVTTGPVATPFFLAYGLRRGAYIATESACVVVMHVTRAVVLARFALLTREAVWVGLALGATMFLGAWAARALLERMSDRVFLVLIESLLVVMGLQFLLVPR